MSVIFRYIKPKPSKIQTLPSVANRRSEAQERGKPHSVDVRPPIHVRGRPLLHKVAVGASDYGAAVDLRWASHGQDCRSVAAGCWWYHPLAPLLYHRVSVQAGVYWPQFPTIFFLPSLNVLSLGVWIASDTTTNGHSSDDVLGHKMFCFLFSFVLTWYICSMKPGESYFQ